jgi:hypothetical protein
VRGVVGIQESRRPLRPLHEVVLDRGAALEDADQVLEALLSRVGRLGGADGIRHVALERDVLPAALVSDREVGLARDVGLDLDEVDAAALEHDDGAAAVLGRRDRDGGGELGLRPVEHGARDDHARTELRAARDVAPRGEDRLEVAAHVAHAGDPVGDEERQRDFAAAGDPVAEERVDVHVPESGDEELPLPVDHPRAFGIFVPPDSPTAAMRSPSITTVMFGLWMPVVSMTVTWVMAIGPWPRAIEPGARPRTTAIPGRRRAGSSCSDDPMSSRARARRRDRRWSRSHAERADS